MSDTTILLCFDCGAVHRLTEHEADARLTLITFGLQVRCACGCTLTDADDMHAVVPLTDAQMAERVAVRESDGKDDNSCQDENGTKG